MSKLFKNPARGQSAQYQPYIPQYQLRGIVPAQAGEPLSAPGVVSPQNSRGAAFVLPKKPKAGPTPLPKTQNVPYAEVGQAFNGSVPNIGNNIENTWASVDEMVVDETENYVQVDPDQLMVDNNLLTQTKESEMTVVDAGMLDIGYDEYVLLVQGEIVNTGKFESIQQEIRDLIFNEHPLSVDNSIVIDDIVVLKRIKVKVGVFLGE